MKRGFLNISIFIILLPFNNVYSNELVNNHCPFYNHFLISYLHPVHISYTNIEFNQKTNKFEILFKLFVDDFSRILNNKYGKNLDLKSISQSKVCRETVEKYIFEHFKLIINGKDKTKADLKMEKMETKDVAIWLYFSFSVKGNCNTFDIYNSLMNDLYQDQTNLLIFSVVIPTKPASGMGVPTLTG